MKNSKAKSLKICIAFTLLLTFLITTNILAAGLANRVADIYSGASNSDPQYMAVFNNKLYFAANGGDGTGTELWVYDGSNAPSRVADIRLGVNSSYPQYLAVFNNKLYFAANGGFTGTELWVYDGNNTPSSVADISLGVSSSDPQYLEVFNSKLYFGANGGDGAGTELWVYDGSNAPSRATDIYSGASSSFPRYLTVFNNKLYFAANGGDGVGTELWVYDGSNAPSRVADIRSGVSSSYPQYLAVFNNKLYFAANRGDGTGRELWVYDGSNAPSLVADIWSGGDSDPQHLDILNTKLFFSANGGDGAGRELWVFDGSNTPSLVVDIYSGASNSYPQHLAVLNNRLYFAANGGDGAGRELWVFTDDNVSPVVLSSSPSNGETIQPTNTISVTFSEDVLHDGSTGAANATSNYRLYGDNGDGIDVTDCNSTTGEENDLTFDIDDAIYDNNSGLGPYQITLGVNESFSLPNGSYRLIVCGKTSVHDLAGNPLNDGEFDTLIDFTVLTQSEQSGVTLPNTGFAPGVVTGLPIQPVVKAYSDLNELSLEIPSLGVFAPIVGVSVIQDGWDLSWLQGQVGWLHGTAFPTWAGNSALTAHVYDSNGQPGLFTDLHKLKWGEEVVVNAWGQSYIYEVRSVKQYVKPDDISIIRHEEYPWITLITCRDYDPENDAYRWRVVVRAVQVRVK